jgi:hypothetical protein
MSEFICPSTISQALPARLHCIAPDVVRGAVVSDVRKRADGGRVDVVRRVWMDDDDECDGTARRCRRRQPTDSSGCTIIGIEF